MPQLRERLMEKISSQLTKMESNGEIILFDGHHKSPEGIILDCNEAEPHKTTPKINAVDEKYEIPYKVIKVESTNNIQMGNNYYKRSGIHSQLEPAFFARTVNSDNKIPKDKFIFFKILVLLKGIETNFRKAIETARENMDFAPAYSEEKIIQGLIKRYCDVMKNPEEKIEVFHYIVLPKTISDNFLRILIEIFKKRLLLIESGKRVRRVIWTKSAKNLRLLLKELSKTGYKPAIPELDKFFNGFNVLLPIPSEKIEHFAWLLHELHEKRCYNISNTKGFFVHFEEYMEIPRNEVHQLRGKEVH